MNDQFDFRKIRAKYPDAILRSTPSAIYNCHGRTFASGRAKISDSTEVQKILNEDGYKEIKEVLAGDVIIYFEKNGDYQHSGIVIEVPNPSDRLSFPLIVSKWGNYYECIHAANSCPYNFPSVRYYRQDPHVKT